MAADLVAIILCGGHGKRLWPLSTPTKPKPFHALTGRETLFQQALRRAVAPPFTKQPIVVALADHAALAREQATAIDVSVDLILESKGHDTGLAVLLGALAAEELHGPIMLAILASDHHIPDGVAFSAMMGCGVEAAKGGDLVVFGVLPREASSAYGYVLPDPADPCAASRKVRRFAEKPDQAAARDLIAQGARWNSGNFVMLSAGLAIAAQRHAPHMWEAAKSGLAARQSRGGALLVSPVVETRDAVSFDRAIVERLDHVSMVPADLEWSDVGSWDELRRIRSGEGSFILGVGMPVRVVGLDDIIVVATADGVLVTRSGQSEALKSVLDADGN